MGYSTAMKAAGAKVFDYKETGSYQGSWYAFVEYKGQVGIAEGSYGSCSGCDSYEAEFGFCDYPEERDGKYYKDWNEEVSKEEYETLIDNYNKRLSDFGESYLKNISTREMIETRIANLKEDDWFDEEEKEGLDWCIEMFNQGVNDERSVATDVK